LTGALAELLRPLERSLRILWVAVTLSIGVYVGLAYVVAEPAPDPTQAPMALRRALAATAVVVAVASFALSRVLLSDARLRDRLRSDPAPADLVGRLRAGTPAADAALRAARALAPHERRLAALAVPVWQVTLVRLVLHEGIAVLGLVLAVLGQTFSLVLPYALAAFALNLLVPPRLGAALERARAQVEHGG